MREPLPSPHRYPCGGTSRGRTRHLHRFVIVRTGRVPGLLVVLLRALGTTPSVTIGGGSDSPKSPSIAMGSLQRATRGHRYSDSEGAPVGLLLRNFISGGRKRSRRCFSPASASPHNVVGLP